MVLMFLFILSSAVFAAEEPYSLSTEWVKINNDTGKQLDTDWYYTPAYTKINSQGRLETWTKDVYIGNGTSLTEKGNYSIIHVFVNPAFEKYMSTEWSDFKADGTLVKKIVDYDSLWIKYNSWYSF